MQQATIPGPTTRLHIVIASLFIFVAVMMVFANSVNAGFVNWDDDIYVTENPHVRHLTLDDAAWLFSHTYYYSWIPVTLLSHAIDVACWGMNPKGHHLTNVILHALNAVWFFLVSMLLLTVRPKRDASSGELPLGRTYTHSIVVGSLIGAMLYAGHPLRVESVAWVSERKDLLCVFFLLPALGAYLLWTVNRKRWLFIAVHVLFVLALMSKPMAMPFPVILILIDVWWLKKDVQETHALRSILVEKSVLILLGAAAAAVTAVAAAGGTVNVVKELSVVERFLLPAYAMAFYLWKIILPVDLSPVYPEVHRLVLFASPVLFMGIAYACMMLIGKGRSGAALAFFSFVLLLLPTFLGLSSGLQPIADRYTYVSTIGIFIFIGGCAEWLWSKSSVSLGRLYQREVILGVLILLCGINMYRAIHHTAIWNNSVSLWSQAVRTAPAAQAEFDSRKPYMKPDYLDAYINLGVAYYEAGSKDKAVAQFNKALSLDPLCADAHYNLGNLKFESGDRDGSVRCYLNTVACDSMYAKAYYNLGILYAKDSVNAAVAAFRKAAKLGFPAAQQTLLNNGLNW